MEKLDSMATIETFSKMEAAIILPYNCIDPYSNIIKTKWMGAAPLFFLLIALTPNKASHSIHIYIGVSKPDNKLQEPPLCQLQYDE